MDVIPALLTDQKNVLQHMIALCEHFTQAVQIDIMDGLFVPSKSITAVDLAEIQTSLFLEIHLMVQDPLSYIDSFKKAGADAIIFHSESVEKPEPVITTIKEAGLLAGIAVNPATDITFLSSLYQTLDQVLLMTVEPGFYGSAFIPDVLRKIQRVRALCPGLKISLDGGISLANSQLVKQYQPEQVCIGSAIMKHPHPAQAFAQLYKAYN